MRLLLALLLLPLVVLIPSCGGQVEVDDGLPKYWHDVTGNWSGTQKVMGSEEAFDASYKVYIEGNNLIHEFTSNFGGGFTGKESMHTHDNPNDLHATWTDSMEPEAMSSSGSYDAATKTLTMSGEGADWNDPEKTVTYKHVTVYGEGTSNYTMIIIDAEGNENEVMWIEMTKISD